MTRITALTDPTKLPNPSQDQTTFDANFVYYFENLLLRAQQENAMAEEIEVALASFNSALAGNAYAIPYKVDLNSTADADPGAGKLRFNHATPSLATALRLNLFGSDTADYRKSIDTFDASSSVVKGTIRIVKLGDSRKFLAYNVTARATPTGYRNITVAPVDFSAASPFVHDEQVLLFFQRTGDKGDKGDQGEPGTLLAPTLHVRDERPSGTDGGAQAESSWVTRVLNTVKLNSISGASLASNRVTLPAGTYEFEGSAPACTTATHQARLYNVTDLAMVDQGTPIFSASQASTRSQLKGRFTINAPKVFEIQHFMVTAGGARSTGYPAATGLVEVYSEIIFKKVT